MPSRQELKQRAAEVIDHHGQELIGIAQTILEHPEPGFREVKTGKLVAEKMRELGLAPRTGIALTGVKAVVSGGAGPGPTVGV
ncbi:MAG: amidohydrolase, partial [Chloroflexi bacterium]|nr:amidohydrolase [Chloroflexota bacterium]